MFSLSHCANCLFFRVFFGLYGVAASSLIGLYDLVLVSVVSPFCRTRDVNPLFALAFLSSSSMSDCVYLCSCMRM